MPAATRRELTESIAEEATRVNRLIGNILDMSRLESGVVPVNREWQSLEEVIGAALARLEPRLEGRDVTVELPPGPALVPLDEVLIEQVIFNLLENAIKYTPAGSPIEIHGARTDREATIEIRDRGPGLLPGQEDRVFEKFY